MNFAPVNKDRARAQSYKRESGFSILWISILLTLVIALFGIAMDSANLYRAKMRLQRAVDAGVVTATTTLRFPNGNVTAAAMAEQIALENLVINGEDTSRLASLSATSPVAGDPNRVSLQGTLNVANLFLNMLPQGPRIARVASSASAVARPTIVSMVIDVTGSMDLIVSKTPDPLASAAEQAQCLSYSGYCQDYPFSEWANYTTSGALVDPAHAGEAAGGHNGYNTQRFCSQSVCDKGSAMSGGVGSFPCTYVIAPTCTVKTGFMYVREAAKSFISSLAEGRDAIGLVPFSKVAGVSPYSGSLNPSGSSAIGAHNHPGMHRAMNSGTMTAQWPLPSWYPTAYADSVWDADSWVPQQNIPRPITLAFKTTLISNPYYQVSPVPAADPLEPAQLTGYGAIIDQLTTRPTTNAFAGLQLGYNQILTFINDPANVSFRSARKIILFLTDGMPNSGGGNQDGIACVPGTGTAAPTCSLTDAACAGDSPKASAIFQADLARALGIEVWAVGINIPEAEGLLRRIANAAPRGGVAEPTYCNVSSFASYNTGSAYGVTFPTPPPIGLYGDATNPQDLQSILNALAKNVRGQLVQ